MLGLLLLVTMLLPQRHPCRIHRIPMEESAHIRAKLLTWYDANRRALPWRGDPPPYDRESPPAAETAKVTPYETWVSEVMCQQTRVETVVPYFLRWLERFPTVQALAEASADEVNAAWAGLGFYRRARLLHQGAKDIVDAHGGIFPDTAEALRGISGIGEYTSGAVASIAFGELSPCVDGNVLRVSSRLGCVMENPKSKALRDYSKDLMTALVNCSRPGDVNQAVMELGATVCVPSGAPKCSECPVEAHCLARHYESAGSAAAADPKYSVDLEDGAAACEICAGGAADGVGSARDLPLRAPKKQPRLQVFAVCVSMARREEGGEWAYRMRRRPGDGLLAGQYEFPCEMLAEQSAKAKALGAEEESALRDEAGAKEADAVESLRLGDEPIARVGEVQHLFSHLRHEMRVYVEVVAEAADQGGCEWISEDDMRSVGITTGMKKVLKLLKKELQDGTGTPPVRRKRRRPGP